MVSVPGQTVVLSHERVSFGNLPLFSKTRKVVFMTNTSDHTISYSWHVSNSGDEKVSINVDNCFQCVLCVDFSLVANETLKFEKPFQTRSEKTLVQNIAEIFLDNL